MSQREGHATGGAGSPTPPADAPSSARVAVRTTLNHAESNCQPTPSLELNEDPTRLFLRKLFSDRVPPAPLATPITVHDTSLDANQRDAVARAAQAPDLFLIQGPAGTGKSRVAVEVLRQVADGGGRVLFLTPAVASLDARLNELAATPGLSVMRRIGPGECPEGLAPTVAAWTPARRQAETRLSLIRRAAESLSAAEERVRRAELALPMANELAALTARLTAKSAERQALVARQTTLEAEVQREVEASVEPAPYFVQRVRRVAAAHGRRSASLDGAAAELATTRAEAEVRRASAESVCLDLRPKAAALTVQRWYTPTYWRARFDSTLASRLTEAEGQLTAAKTALDELAVREQKLTADRRLADEELSTERARLVGDEVARRQSDMDAQVREIDQAMAADGVRSGEVLSACRKAGIDLARGPAAVADELETARRELATARGWKTEVDARVDELAREACQKVNVVVGPVAGIADDPDVAVLGSFDLLIIDDAHQLAEPDFVAAARFSPRWILIGEPIGASKGKGPTLDLFARLTAALRHEVWGHDGPRLVCRLHPVRGPDRRRLECEPVADAADIELRLFTPPGSEPTLAEVAFPDRFTPQAAREYLVRELSEVTCQPRTRTGTWETTDTGSVVRFGASEGDAVLAEIGPGIREELVGLETRAVHFAADWSIERAKEWAAENIGRRESGRVAVLSHPYRACPGLAQWLNRAFAAGFAVSVTADEVPHVEFLAVPDTDPLRRERGRSARVGGAGYEIDLCDARQRAALPPELRDLPATGFVNVPEAQALLRFLEPFAGPGVVITSPFPTQVAVLRRLQSRMPRIAHVPVLDPAEIATKECDLLAVSLTRSHVARAVSFGDNPTVLAGLLARARKKVLFAGDPGTLARRLQWEGPVDHLGATEAGRERAWVAALADCPRVAAPRRRPGSNENART